MVKILNTKKVLLVAVSTLATISAVEELTLDGIKFH